MAKIQSEKIVITVSRIVKDSDSVSDSIVNDEIIAALEQVAQELIGNSQLYVVVEITTA